MPEDEPSDSKAKENDSDCGSEELETPRNGKTLEISEYEKQRLKRIEENRARMEALGLRKMASSLMGSTHKTKKKSDKKGKRKVGEEDDEEYKPNPDEERLSSSSEGDDNDDHDYKSSGSRKKKAKKKSTTPKKNSSVQKPLGNSDFVHDDDALMQAIALSLQDSVGFLDVVSSVPSHGTGANAIEGKVSERKGKAKNQEETRGRKRKKTMTNRVQMTEDELILHFFQFDEAGKGSITLRDLRRMAVAHDFTWTDEEMANMIFCFDSDGDGKLNLEDFHKIVSRCNMIQGSENVVMGSKA